MEEGTRLGIAQIADDRHVDHRCSRILERHEIRADEAAFALHRRGIAEDRERAARCIGVRRRCRAVAVEPAMQLKQEARGETILLERLAALRQGTDRFGVLGVREESAGLGVRESRDHDGTDARAPDPTTRDRP